MTEYDGFRVERDDGRGVATITLDVPGKLNRVSMLARDQLSAVFAELDADDSVRFVVLTGAGGAVHGRRRHRRLPDEVALGRLAAREERRGAGALLEAGDREARRGTCSASGSSSRSRATSGSRPTTCSSALPGGDDRDDPRLGRHAAAGPADRRRPGEGHRHARPPGRGRGGARDRPRDRGRRGRRARRTVASLVDELSRHSPLSLAMAKRVLNTVYDGPLHVGLELEGLAYGLMQQTHDFREGVEAFVEKRRPEFTGD